MIKVVSERAFAALEKSNSVKKERTAGMQEFPLGLTLWGEIEIENERVKNLSFFGELEDWQKVLLESMASLLIGGPITRIKNLTIRECEAFLRDKNSVPALATLSSKEEKQMDDVISWVGRLSSHKTAQNYQFLSEKGPFRALSLVAKVKEIKDFLGSSKVVDLYHDSVLPRLIDIEDLTAYILVPYETDEDKKRFEELYILGLETFQEENLNFIPEV